ncbi:MAG: glycosyltransferase family 2 protein [Ferruginibacter sp.]
MQHGPLVTIGVPNYNYSHYVLDTLNSIILQSYLNIELIIVDDLSTDDSVTVIENWINEYSGSVKIKFIKNTLNLGLTKVCNIILQNANGKYFQTLDADDLLSPEKIARQVAIFETANNAALIYSNVSIIDDRGGMIHADYLGRLGYNNQKMPQGKIFDSLIEFNFIPLPSVLVNTKLAANAGGFDETLQVQDYYLWLKLSEKYEVIYLPEITAFYREHSTSMSNSSATNPKSTDSVLDIKYSYYKQSGQNVRQQIRKDIFFSAAYLYRSNYPLANKWLKRNLLLNPGPVSIVYFVANKLGIPCSRLDRLKKYFSNKNGI